MAEAGDCMWWAQRLPRNCADRRQTQGTLQQSIALTEYNSITYKSRFILMHALEWDFLLVFELVDNMPSM